MFFQMKLTKDKMLCRFLSNSIYKTIPLFIEVEFFDGEEESYNVLGLIIITITACFGFSSEKFINHCLANKLKAKEKSIRKTNQNSIVESISLVIKVRSSRLVPE